MDDVESLISILEEAIYLIDAKGMVPAAMSLRDRRGGGVRAVFDVIPLEQVKSIGPVPKGIARYALRLDEDESGWLCHIVVDV
jgi:SHS2 domain-containing protein